MNKKKVTRCCFLKYVGIPKMLSTKSPRFISKMKAKTMKTYPVVWKKLVNNFPHGGSFRLQNGWAEKQANK